jgi:hypothetical protein
VYVVVPVMPGFLKGADYEVVRLVWRDIDEEADDRPGGRLRPEVCVAGDGERGRGEHLVRALACALGGQGPVPQWAQPATRSSYGTEGQRFESSRARCRIPLGKGISGGRRTPRGGNSGGNRATLMVLPLQPTEVPGVYRRGSRFVVVYRVEGRQREQSADTLAEARAIKLKRDGEARAKRRGPTLHEFSLSWLDRYAGTGHDSADQHAPRIPPTAGHLRADLF